MIATYWTFIRSLAFWQFLFWIFANIVSVTLLFMARLTKVSISPTEPLSRWTTKLTFKLNKILTMFWAVFYGNLATVGANKLLCLKRACVLLVIHCVCTIFTTTKIGIFTFKTLKIRIYCHCILIWLLIIGWFRIFKLLIFVTTLKFKPLKRHGLDFIKYIRVILYKNI